MSSCHCRVQAEQAKAWKAASGSKEANAADWKQAHEVICALDPTISCDELPDCPAVEQVTLSNDVSNEKCTQAQSDGCDKLSEYCIELLDNSSDPARQQAYWEHTGKFCLGYTFKSSQGCLDATKHINQCGVKGQMEVCCDGVSAVRREGSHVSDYCGPNGDPKYKN